MEELLNDLNAILHNIEKDVVNPIKKFDDEWELYLKPRKHFQRYSNVTEKETMNNKPDTIQDQTSINCDFNHNGQNVESQEEGNQDIKTTARHDIHEESGASNNKSTYEQEQSHEDEEGEACGKSQFEQTNTTEITSENNQIEKSGISDINEKKIKETEEQKLTEISVMNFEIMKELKNRRSKITRTECRCIVFGETSAGKSTLISALLNRDDLPMKCGRTTNCFVEISLGDETCFMIEDETKNDIKLLKNKITYTSKNRLENGSRVSVSYKREDCSFLQENMTIIDIPGLDTDPKIDDKIVKYCTEADILILVINATLCIKGTIKKFINEFQTRFTKLNFFLVFNHCDQLDEEVDRDKVKDQLVEAAENVFRKELKYSINLVGDRTFFISARDQMRINGNEEYMKGNRNRESRSKEFNRLINKIKETVSIDGFQRRYKYLKELYDIVEQNIKECESLILEVKEKMSDISKESCKILNTFNYSIKRMEEVTKPAFDHIIERLKYIKNNENESRTKDSLEESENSKDEPEQNEDSKGLKQNIKQGVSYCKDKIGSNISWFTTKFSAKESASDDTTEQKRNTTLTEAQPSLRMANKTEFRRMLIDCLFKEVGKDFEDVKTEIIECIKLNQSEYLKNSLLFLDKLYFSCYLKKEISLEDNVKYDDSNPTDLNELPVDLDQIIDQIDQMKGTELLKGIVNYLYKVNDDSKEVKLEINKINNLNKDDQRNPILLLENLLYLCFVDPRVQSVDPKIETLIYKWIQKELNEKYTIFLDEIGKLMLEEFEKQFGNDSTVTIKKIKSDLDQINNKMDQIKNKMDQEIK